MDQTTRNHLQRATQDARRLLEADFAAQLEGTFDILPDGRILPEPGKHLDDRQRLVRREIIEAIAHIRAKEAGKTSASAIDDYRREAAFTALNRFVALKMLEARGLVQQCVSKGDQSSGFKEFIGLAPGLADLPDKGYQLYLECLFDELGTEVKVLFDRRDPASLLWPRRQTMLDLVEILNTSELEGVWGQDETIGWVYQYFNGQEERRAMREASAAPRNSRELAVRNQFFTPRYVVEFLTDNTLGRIWYEMRQGRTRLNVRCRYLVRRPGEVFLSEGENPPETSERQESLSQGDLLKQPVYISFRSKKDPRDLKILDPACGSGHFLLYAFDLLIEIYLDAWEDESSPQSEATGQKLRADHPTHEALRLAIPGLILRYNLHGIDIDARCAQIAALALWMRAQRAFSEFQVARDQRHLIRKTNIVVAEPMPGEAEMLDGFLRSLREDRLEALIRKALDLPENQRVRATKAMADSLCQLVRIVWEAMKLAGEAGSLLRIEDELTTAIEAGRDEWEEKMPLFRVTEYSMDKVSSERYYRQLPGEGQDFWDRAETLTIRAIEDYAVASENGDGFRRKMFAEDATRGFSFIDLCRRRYDVALMNPPFGDGSLPSKPYIDDTYGDTKGDVYKAFVECCHSRLTPAGFLGVISSRTGFFLGQSEDWRTRVVLRLFRPIALADLGDGVLDAMVEVAAYVLRSLSASEVRDLTLSTLPAVEKVALDRQGRFSLPKWQAARQGLKRHQAAGELERLAAAGFIVRCPGSAVRYEPLRRTGNALITPRGHALTPMVCIRALEDENKAVVLVDAARGLASGKTFICDPTGFHQLPGRTFGYWVSERLRRLFTSMPLFRDSPDRLACITNPAGDDTRYFRCFWEPPAELLGRTKRWAPLVKGGAFSRYFADPHLVVSWDDKLGSYSGFLGTPHRPLVRPASSDSFFRQGITYSRRSQKGFSARALPAGTIFHDKGPGIFAPECELLPMLAVLNSSLYSSLLALQMAFGSYEVGAIQRTPMPGSFGELSAPLAALALRAWCERRCLEITVSTSHAFVLPALLAASGSTLGQRVAQWTAKARSSTETVAACQAEIDELALRLYGLCAIDVEAMNAAVMTEGVARPELGEDEEDELPPPDSRSLAADLLAYAMGAAFGRWDMRFATGQKPVPGHPAPFDALPICPPGMLRNDGGLHAAPSDVPSDYPVRISWPGILVDDPGHEEDVESRASEILTVIWSERSNTIAREICGLLGVRSLRDFFRKPSGFFADHLKRHSKSRRQAPIYWLLSTGSGNYALWLYYSRLNRDTLSLALEDFARPKLRHEQKLLNQLRGEAGLVAPRRRREGIEAQGSLVNELFTFVEELERVAPLWNPDLNDGVIINYAPLWRLIGHTPWRKTVKECWETLCAGDYDWSHLAMHLWPERVVPKCATDRSLAIAHRIEDEFWTEGTDGKWKPRATPTRPVDELVLERSSSAVKAALKSLLEAPSPGGGTMRSRKGKTHA